MNENSENSTQLNNQTSEQIQAIKTSEFMKETIKQRPINKRKLVRRLLLTVSMALIFGIVACLTFIVLEPIINQKITRDEEKVSPVSFEEETAEEETKREDMIADSSELAPVIIEQVPVDNAQIEQVLSQMKWGVNDYLSLSTVITDMAKSISTSMVSVVGIKHDTDWFANNYDNQNVVSGVIIADNGRDILMLANLKKLADYDSIRVTFFDGTIYDATIIMSDSSTGLGIVSVRKNLLLATTAKDISIIEIGSSASKNLIGSPIVAMGSPYGTLNSLGIGYITSAGNAVNVPDASYNLLYTDITASSQASGILVNLNGQLVGIIDQSFNSSDMSSIISGLGITELKYLIERLSNGMEIPYLGLYGTEVTDEISEDLGVPKGLYITGMEMDSPLMETGIQSGDVIVKFAGVEITKFRDYMMSLYSMTPENEVSVEVMRQSPDGYTKLTMNVVLAHQDR